jgi:phosphohistidine phosphatase
MLLYLVRHGEAKKETEDPAQGLTDKGGEDVRKTASAAFKLTPRLSEIYHSPKTRAQQTAAILAEHLKPERGMRPSDHLLPLDDPGVWASRVVGIDEDVMLVGHLPFLARLAGLLLCGNQETVCVEFGTASMLCLIRSGEGRWSVKWMIVPDMTS